ncbi:MAG: hypothetical protein ABWX96_03860 [Propionibacteriaceae bacterium]
MTSRRSQQRRSRLSYLAVLRGTSSYNRQARQIRLLSTLAALVLVLPSRQAGWAVPLVLLALAGPLLNYAMALYYRGRLRQLRVLRTIAGVTDRTEGRQQLNFIAYVELAGLVALAVVFSYVVTDLSATWRLLGLLLAVAYTTSVGHGIYSDHTWFNPRESHPPWWHELLRLFAGPSTAIAFAALALPGDWTASQRIAVLVISGLLLAISVRVWDLDSTIAVVPGIVEEERRLGRELVVREMGRALTPSVLEMERLTEPYRDRAPVLYELALHARTRLEEALDAGGAPSRQLTIDNLLGPVLTLARAIGVTVDVELEVTALSEANAETASWVLRDLVGNAINADATALEVRLRRDGAALEISITDDASAMHLGVWKAPGTSSAQLERHLISLEGALEMQEKEQGKIVTARWSPQHADEQQADDGWTNGGRNHERKVGAGPSR